MQHCYYKILFSMKYWVKDLCSFYPIIKPHQSYRVVQCLIQNLNIFKGKELCPTSVSGQLWFECSSLCLYQTELYLCLIFKENDCLYCIGPGNRKMLIFIGGGWVMYIFLEIFFKKLKSDATHHCWRGAVISQRDLLFSSENRQRFCE